jgi:8-oxo-dGTP diphosphatase
MTAGLSNTAPAWSDGFWKIRCDSLASSDRITTEDPDLIKQVVAALILRGNEILCCQRTEHQALALKWEFPGGKIEAGETPAQALQRELEEELGIIAQVGREITQVLHTYQNGNSVNLHFYGVDRYDNELQNRIFRDVRWVERSELPFLDFLDADKELVQKLAAGELI